MQIASRFTIAVHILACVAYFQDETIVTSSFLSQSVGVNPVIIRNVMTQLKEAGLIHISQGKSGIRAAKPLSEISFYDVYRAVGSVAETGLFSIHDQPNPACPVGRNIQSALTGRLRGVQDVMENELRGITLADVADDIIDAARRNAG